MTRPGPRRSRLISAVLLLSAMIPWLLTAEARAFEQPNQTPVLMLDSGMHVGQIYRVSVDGAGRTLATGSTDKSIRIWDIASGRQLRRLHVPVGQGPVGSVLSVAMTPNGKYLLAASQSFVRGGDFDRGSVYFFHVERGKMIGRIPELPANVTHIATSPDGKRFALVLGKWGFSLRDTGGKTLYSSKNVQDDAVEYLAFSQDGRFATVTRKGLLRVYTERGGKLTATKPKRLGKGLIPYSVAFSPDDKRIAVGYSNAAQVDVVDANTLKTLSSLTSKTVKTGNLGAVAWVAERNGAWLYAAGTAKSRQDRNVVVAWPGARRGAELAIGISRDSITHLTPVKGGGVIFASSEPAWGHVTQDRAGRRLVVRLQKQTGAIPFRAAARQSFAISDDGSSVVIPAQGRRLTFSLSQLALSATTARNAAWQRPRETDRAIRISDWYAKNRFTIGGKAITLFPGERALSLDLGQRKQDVLVGTDYFLRLYDRNGNEVANRRLTTPAWGIARADRANVVAVAHGDGTIRWYSLRNDLALTELASVFVHKDRRRWVAWTADGLFAHSDYGGESMVGYFQNGIIKKGDIQRLTGEWVGLDQMYRLFYNPEQVSRVLAQPDTWRQITSGSRIKSVLAAPPPPIVQVQSYCPLSSNPNVGARRGLMAIEEPNTTGQAGQSAAGLDQCFDIGAREHGFGAANASGAPLGTSLPPGTKAVKLRLKFASGGGDGVIDAFVNGRNVGRFSNTPTARGPQATPNAAKDGATFEGVVPVYAGQNEIVLRAYNAAGIFRPSDAVFFHMADAPVAATLPTLHVLAVGVDKYQGQINPLNFAVADANGFANTVRKLKPDMYGAVKVVTLVDKEATRDRIVKEFERLAAAAKADDAVMIYLAGHGISDRQGNYFFVPISVRSRKGVWSGGLKHQRMVELLAGIHARNVFLFLDTCYSGEFRLNAYGPDNLANETGRFVLTASTSEQEALDSLNGKNGVFAVAVQEALNTRPRDAAVVDALDVGLAVRRAVPKLAKTKQFDQSAVFKAAGGDLSEFPVAQP
ncbi:MAG: caspase family protein [Pseudomonadota bacterium]